MRNKKILFGFILLILACGIAVFVLKGKKPTAEETKEVKPTRGEIQSLISTPGTVLPKNRLEIKPPVGGRIDEILVQEGDKVKTGQILAWMSSTERAALLDAARGKGEEALKYWKDAYKAIPLMSPIDGEVIVEKIQPGQTVTTSDAVTVLSDKLIVRAEVDETDIGKIKVDQAVVIALDAYPDTKIKGAVDHIYYESKTVNNVTIYEVDVLPDTVPDFFRSGMNATVDFILESKADALLVPLEALHKQGDEDFLLVKQSGSTEPVKRAVKLGIINDKHAEVVSGITQEDTIILKGKKYVLPKAEATNSPFTPFGRKKDENKK